MPSYLRAAGGIPRGCNPTAKPFVPSFAKVDAETPPASVHCDPTAIAVNHVAAPKFIPRKVQPPSPVSTAVGNCPLSVDTATPKNVPAIAIVQPTPTAVPTPKPTPVDEVKALPPAEPIAPTPVEVVEVARWSLNAPLRRKVYSAAQLYDVYRGCAQGLTKQIKQETYCDGSKVEIVLNAALKPAALPQTSTVHIEEPPMLCDTKKFSRVVLSTLNKLTPEKYEPLMANLLQHFTGCLSFDCAVKVLLETVYRKALDESRFAGLYATMCRDVYDAIVNKMTSKKSHSFHVQLLDTCQEEFLRPCLVTQDSMVLETLRARKINNAKFIAELVVAGMIPKASIPALMEQTVSMNTFPRLLRSDQEFRAEAACAMIAICGKDLHNFAPQKASDWTDVLTTIQQTGGVSSRIQFLVITALESIENGWEAVTKKATKIMTVSEVASALGFSSPQPLPREAPTQATPVAQRTVYVTSIDTLLSEADVMRFIMACGEVNKIRLCGNPQHSSQYAFIEFRADKGAQACCRQDGVLLGRHIVRCSMSKNAVHDTHPTDAVDCPERGRIKACTFGLKEGVVCACPLRESSVQQIVTLEPKAPAGGSKSAHDEVDMQANLLEDGSKRVESRLRAMVEESATGYHSDLERARAAKDELAEIVASAPTRAVLEGGFSRLVQYAVSNARRADFRTAAAKTIALGSGSTLADTVHTAVLHALDAVVADDVAVDVPTLWRNMTHFLEECSTHGCLTHSVAASCGRYAKECEEKVNAASDEE